MNVMRIRLMPVSEPSPRSYDESWLAIDDEFTPPLLDTDLFLSRKGETLICIGRLSLWPDGQQYRALDGRLLAGPTDRQYRALIDPFTATEPIPPGWYPTHWCGPVTLP